MTEITRVPLQPIAKGALTKLWVGIAAVALAAGGVAYATMPASVQVETIKAGTGPSPTIEDVAVINYKGSLRNGKVFDEGKQVPLPLQGVIPGFTQALEKMQRGGKYRVEIPSDLAYGPKDQTNPRTGEVAIPGGSDLIFDIELLEFMPRAEFEQRMQMMQQLQQQMQGAAPGAAPKGAPAPTPPAPKQ